MGTDYLSKIRWSPGHIGLWQRAHMVLVSMVEMELTADLDMTSEMIQSCGQSSSESWALTLAHQSHRLHIQPAANHGFNGTMKGAMSTHLSTIFLVSVVTGRVGGIHPHIIPFGGKGGLSKTEKYYWGHKRPVQVT